MKTIEELSFDLEFTGESSIYESLVKYKSGKRTPRINSDRLYDLMKMLDATPNDFGIRRASEELSDLISKMESEPDLEDEGNSKSGLVCEVDEFQMQCEQLVGYIVERVLDSLVDAEQERYLTICAFPEVYLEIKDAEIEFLSLVKSLDEEEKAHLMKCIEILLSQQKQGNESVYTKLVDYMEQVKPRELNYDQEEKKLRMKIYDWSEDDLYRFARHAAAYGSFDAACLKILAAFSKLDSREDNILKAMIIQVADQMVGVKSAGKKTKITI